MSALLSMTSIMSVVQNELPKENEFKCHKIEQQIPLLERKYQFVSFCSSSYLYSCEKVEIPFLIFIPIIRSLTD